MTIGFNQMSFTLPPTQTYSQTAGGSVLAESSTSPLWKCNYTTKPLKHSEAVTFEAKLRSLRGMMNTFEAYDVRRPYPLAYPTGNFPAGYDEGEALIHTVTAGGGSIRLKGLPVGFVLSVGDYFSFTYGSSPSSRALHQVMEAAVADGSGNTAAFEVQPFIRSGAVADIVVTLTRPSALFTLTPKDVDQMIQDVMFGQVGFDAVQYLP